MVEDAMLQTIGILCVHICVELSSLPTSRVLAREQRTPGSVRTFDEKERARLEESTVPFPGSVRLSEVAANITAIAQQGTVAAYAGLHELGAGHFRIARLLQVKRDGPPAGWPSSREWPTNYLVAELHDVAGHPLALFALTRGGAFMALQSLRGVKEPVRSLDHETVAKLVLRRRGRAPLAIEYQYFHNVVEPGLSLFRPLVAATTEHGVIYFNSQGEAFAEEGSALIEELEPRGAAFAIPPGMRRLRSLGRW